MSLEDSPFSSINLRKKPKRFMTLLGVSIKQFDDIFNLLQVYEMNYQKQRHLLWSETRIERMVERNKTTLREHLYITLLYFRQYNVQEVLATSFGISQSLISKIINRISQILEQLLPVPSKLTEDLSKVLKGIKSKTRNQYSTTLLLDASEQRVERNSDSVIQRKDYSGKKVP